MTQDVNRRALLRAAALGNYQVAECLLRMGGSFPVARSVAVFGAAGGVGTFESVHPAPQPGEVLRIEPPEGDIVDLNIAGEQLRFIGRP